MFPTPQAALPLPPRPDLKKYKKPAKNLVKACRWNDPSAIRSWAVQWVEALVKLSGLSMTADLPVGVDRWVDQVASFAQKQLSDSEKQGMTCTASGAQFVIARSHGFESHNDAVAFLLDHGADMSDQAGTGETGLHRAVAGAQLPTIKLLIERGARLDGSSSGP